MPDIVTDTFLYVLANGSFDWSTADIRAAIFEAATWTPSKADSVVADATSAGAIECAAAGYAREALVSQVATLDTGGHRMLLDSAVVDFGTLASGTAFDTLMLFVQVTDDTDSWVMATFDLGAQTTSNASPTRFIPDTDGLFRLAQP